MKTPVYCFATIYVPVKYCDDYEEAVQGVMSLFTDRGWELKLALDRDRQFATMGGSPSDHPDEHLHIWRIPDMDSLLSVMAGAADDAGYVALEDMVVKEVQDLSVGLYYDPAYLGNEPEHPTYTRYIVEKLDVSRDAAVRNEFTVQMNYTRVAMKKRGWHLLHAVNCVTGVINRYMHVWGIDDDDPFATFQEVDSSEEAWVKQYKKTVRTWERSVWVPIHTHDHD